MDGWGVCCNRTDRKWRRFITSVWSLGFCLLSKLYIWVDRTDLFKISKLVYGARASVTSLYGNLQKQPVYGRYCELAGWLVVCQCQSWKLGELLGTIDVVNSDSFRHRKSCRTDSILVELTQFKTNRMTRKGVQTGNDMGTTLQKGKPMEFEFSTFWL